jgi:uncharacterized membrane protein
MADWIQVYLLVFVSVCLLMGAYRHGKSRTSKDSFWVSLIGLLLWLPVVGRVLGWW